MIYEYYLRYLEAPDKYLLTNVGNRNGIYLTEIDFNNKFCSYGRKGKAFWPGRNYS